MQHSVEVIGMVFNATENGTPKFRDKTTGGIRQRCAAVTFAKLRQRCAAVTFAKQAWTPAMPRPIRLAASSAVDAASSLSAMIFAFGQEDCGTFLYRNFSRVGDRLATRPLSLSSRGA